MYILTLTIVNLDISLIKNSVDPDQLTSKKLVSVAEETGLSLVCQKPQRQVLSRQGPLRSSVKCNLTE